MLGVKRCPRCGDTEIQQPHLTCKHLCMNCANIFWNITMLYMVMRQYNNGERNRLFPKGLADGEQFIQEAIETENYIE